MLNHEYDMLAPIDKLLGESETMPCFNPTRPHQNLKHKLCKTDESVLIRCLQPATLLAQSQVSLALGFVGSFRVSGLGFGFRVQSLGVKGVNTSLAMIHNREPAVVAKQSLQTPKLGFRVRVYRAYLYPY